MALILSGSTGISTTNGTTALADGAIGTNQLANDAVTTAKIASGAVGTTDIADASVTGAKLENSGVTAGSYGSSSAIPVVTVDAKGRLTSVSTASITSSAPTTAQVLSATAGLSAGAVGTYGFMRNTSNDATFGATTAGSDLRPVGYNINGAFATYQVASQSGTWRCLGFSEAATYGQPYMTLWIRIS